MQCSRIDTGIPDKRFIVDINSAFSACQVIRAEENIYPAICNYCPVCSSFIIPVAVYQSGGGSDFDDRRAVKFRHPEVAQRGVCNILGICNNAHPARVRMQIPPHVARGIGHSLGNLHKHADYAARAVYSKDIAHSSFIKLYVRSCTPPVLHSSLVPSHFVLWHC